MTKTAILKQKKTAEIEEVIRQSKETVRQWCLEQLRADYVIDNVHDQRTPVERYIPLITSDARDTFVDGHATKQLPNSCKDEVKKLVASSSAKRKELAKLQDEVLAWTREAGMDGTPFLHSLLLQALDSAKEQRSSGVDQKQAVINKLRMLLTVHREVDKNVDFYRACALEVTQGMLPGEEPSAASPLNVRLMRLGNSTVYGNTLALKIAAGDVDQDGRNRTAHKRAVEGLMYEYLHKVPHREKAVPIKRAEVTHGKDQGI